MAENRCVDQGTGEEEWPAIQINTTKDKASINNDIFTH